MNREDIGLLLSDLKKTLLGWEYNDLSTYIQSLEDRIESMKCCGNCFKPNHCEGGKITPCEYWEE